MTKEDKQFLDDLCEEYPRDAVMALYEVMPNELYDGIVTTLEDYFDGIYD